MSAPPLGLKATLKEVLRTKSGIIGIIIIIALLLISATIPIYAPYNVIKKWNNPAGWLNNPKTAAPVWVGYLTGRNLPQTIFIGKDQIYKSFSYSGYAPYLMKNITLRTSFTYDYDDFPSEIRVDLAPIIKNTSISISIYLIRPDKRVIKLYSKDITPGSGVVNVDSLYSDQIKTAAQNFVIKNIGEKPIVTAPEVILFAKVDKGIIEPSTSHVLKGRYIFVINAISFSSTADLNANITVFGKIYGLAGTDGTRRDLFIGLLYGTPIALAFGTVAALVVTFLQAVFGVISGYFAGIVDEIIQRITEIFMIIPILPILILISFIYRIDIWTLLLVIVVLSPLGYTTKVTRSMTPQIKEEQYILAAFSYGSGSWRIIFRHILPRVIPYMFSLIAMSVPSYIFLEAALAILGLGDPIRPTWGKILSSAWSSGAAYHGYWWWILLPAGAIAITAIAFALLGYAFDKVINPRLREI